ncbi:MAG: LysR family transcriptional regulator [Caulobacteraceae bacterium]
MDKLDSMRLLVRVVERQSFSAAASDLGLPRSSATTAIKQVEARLGVRLLQRTTRQVTPTLEGEIYYRRCKAILAEIEDAEAALGGGEARGLLRIDVHGPMARTFVLPGLPAFLERHPGLTLHIGEGDRFVDIVREGYDCVIRAGEIADSDMIVRRLGLAHVGRLPTAAFDVAATEHDVDLVGLKRLGRYARGCARGAAGADLPRRAAQRRGFLRAQQRVAAVDEEAAARGRST